MVDVNIFSSLLFSGVLLLKLKSSFWRMLALFLGFYASFLAVALMVVVMVLANFRPMLSSFYGNTSAPAVYPEQTASSTLPQQIEYWQIQLKKQPTSRDILWNLSLLYQANNQTELAQEYKQKAELVDPNYKF